MATYDPASGRRIHRYVQFRLSPRQAQQSNEWLESMLHRTPAPTGVHKLLGLLQRGLQHLDQTRVVVVKEGEKKVHTEEVIRVVRQLLDIWPEISKSCFGDRRLFGLVRALHTAFGESWEEGS